MRSVLLLSLALTMTMVIATAEAEQCPPDYCKTVTCPKELTKEHCHSMKGLFIENSSYCRCCPTCTTYLRPFSTCKPVEHAPGNYYQIRCPMHYICVRDHCHPML